VRGISAVAALPAAAAVQAVDALVVAGNLKIQNYFFNNMKTSQKSFPMIMQKPFFQSAIPRCLVLALVFATPLAISAADTGKTFETPEAAVSALVAAANAQDTNALHDIFGPATEDIANPDRVQAANELEAFTTALNRTNRIVHESDSKCVLEVGDKSWPFPIPVIKQDGKWYFDTEAGKDEILNRRIGENELSTLQVVRGYVEAQREYATKDRDGKEVLKFAQKIISSPGLKDGLYWPPELDGEISPLGPLAADAAAEGYSKTPGNSNERQPFHGYFYKILTRQGKHAPGGKYDYVINGNMIAGFALVAWPAEYGESGVMTFIVNQQGRVYQKDLGPQTAKAAGAMRAYDPDKTWSVSPD
jgi:hypothetical protein